MPNQSFLYKKIAASTEIKTINTFIAHGGPHKVSSSFYVLYVTASISTDDHIRIWGPSSTNPGDTWSGIDIGNEPIAVNVTEQSYTVLYSILEGTTIHVVTMDGPDFNEPHNMWYFTFDTSTDLWAISENVVSTDAVRVQPSIAIRNDGDTIIVYPSNVDKIMGIDRERVAYARRESSSWTTGIELTGDEKADISWVHPFVIRGDTTNDRMHFAYHDFSVGAEAFYGTLKNDNTFGHQHTALATGRAGQLLSYPWWRGVTFDRSGTTVIRFIWKDSNSSTHKGVVLGFDDEDTSTNINEQLDTNAPFSLLGMYTVSIEGNILHSIIFGQDVSLVKITYARTGENNDVWDNMTSVGNFSFNNGRNGGIIIYNRDGNRVIGVFYANVNSNVNGPDIGLHYEEITIERSLVLNPLPFKHIVVR